VIDHCGFTLLTHPVGFEAWSQAVRAVGAANALPLRCLAIGSEGAAEVVDDDGAWLRLSEVEPTGAVLVRPDGHVAWRSLRLPAQPGEELQAVLERLGCRSDVDGEGVR
jgi:hypothetical protein